jgi:CRISPR/Cas system CSM-associated protein Csm3 (group 7 of RAMP superfamily)
MKLTINFYSAWAIGSGKGGDSKDSIILKDDNGLPFIPGRTLKGLIRDAFLECGYKEKEAKLLFGQKKATKEDEDVKLQEGILRFNSAYLSDDFSNLSKELKSYLFKSKTSTRLETNKQAKEHSLRKNEVTIPLELKATILNKDDNSELAKDDYEKIEKALKMLKIMGEKRHRGLGRCKIEVAEFTPSIGLSKEQKKPTSTIRFKCTITEPLVLVKKAKTGQNIESLDYIPGNTFRGIVAGTIANSNNNEFNDIIFNNTVQFGDAHLLINGKRSYKTPFSFFYDKSSEDKTLYNFHFLKEEDWIDKKLKAQKKGYLVEKDGKFIIEKINYGNRIKSSRNYANRSSEDGGMFSYHYLKKGQEFEFEVNSSNKNYLTKIITILDDKTKYFGKSKSAEFGGAIIIRYLGEKEKERSQTKKGKYLYAESNLCFLNEYGEFTATPSIEQLTGTVEQLTDKTDSKIKIDWENSQVKFRTFAPYNFHRKNYDFERLIIEKGSVFVFSQDVEFNTDFLNKGLGCFKTEGYGKVLVNPDFLNKKEVPLNKKEKEDIAEEKDKFKKIKVTGEGVVKILKERYNTTMNELQIEDSVNNTLTFKQQNSSQWARVFNATTRAKDVTTLKHFLWNERKASHNQSIFTGGTNTWEKSDVVIIKKFLEKNKNNEILALRKLAKKMISITSKNKKNELSA